MPRNTAPSMAYAAGKKVADSVDFDSNVHVGMTKCYISKSFSSQGNNEGIKYKDIIKLNKPASYGA